MADASFNYADQTIITKYILDIITQNKQWRRILKVNYPKKGLNLIDYILKFGSPRFASELKDEIYHLKKLHNFTLFEEH